MNVDDNLAAQIASGFGDAVSAGTVPGSRQPRDAAEGLNRAGDALVVSGHDDGIDAGSRGRAAIHVLDHGSSRDVGKHFSGETGRVVSGGDDGDDVLL